MIWLRRLLAIPLGLIAFVCAIGAWKSFAGMLPDSGAGSGAFLALFTAALLSGVYFLLRPDLRRFRAAPPGAVRTWMFTNPLGQAVALYAAAAIVMLAMPRFPLPAGFAAVCAYAILSLVTAVRARRWWAHAGLALLGFVLLLGGLAGTAEALTRGGFGEGGMIFLLPMMGLPVLLALSGLVRAMRRAPTAGSSPRM